MDPTLDTDDFLNAFHHREEADWDKIYENYSAAVDWPSCTFYQDLMVKYPEAKVILTVRSADSWYKSVKNTIHISGPPSTGQKHDKFKKMVHDVCADGVIVDPVKFANEEAVKLSFLQHNEEVKQFVPKERLLVLELGEGWERLCEFLGKDIPTVPYPNSNSTEEFRAKNLQK